VSAENGNYDIILIGSGMGALTVASLMAQMRGKRVLILERHFRAGGFTHAFQRGRFSWDVGVHYIGDVGEGSRLARFFALVTGGKLRWNRMPDPFDVFEYPDLTFAHPVGKERFAEALARLFPSERPAIKRYVKDVYSAANGFSMGIMRRNASAVARSAGRLGSAFFHSNWNLTTGAYLDEHIRDPKLKAILASQWGDYGLPPSLSPFMLHSLIVRHYMDGAYYPAGGAGVLAEAVREIVERAGGKILLRQEVLRILVQNNRATGVLVRTPRGETVEYYAPVVISNAGAPLTYLKLVPENCSVPFRDDLAQFVGANQPTSHLSLYVGFSGDPSQLSFRGENHWLFQHYEHDATYRDRGTWIGNGEPAEIYLSFPSLKDPEARGHTAELISFSDYAPFARWKDQPWRNRDADYQALKARISNALLDSVERRHPGFRKLVEFHELSTPVTNEFMTGHLRGGIYGLPSTAERFRRENQAWTDAWSPIGGLYLTGVDVASLGLAGALMGGITTLGHLPDGISMPDILRQAARQ